MTGSSFCLTSPPDGGISSLTFSSTSQYLLCSSWNKNVSLYDVNADKIRFTYEHKFPVLDACFVDSVNICSGDLDGNVVSYNVNTGRQVEMGKHADCARCVEYSSEINSVVSGGWDSTIKLWDPRASSIAGSYDQPGKVYTMALCGHRLIIGTSGKHVLIYDLRNMSKEEQKRESSLKYQTRCIRAFPNQQGYVLSSIEGRVAVEYIDPSPEIQKKKYAFKSHRLKNNGIDEIYAVYAIAFHNQHNTFATGGADGFVNMWDGMNKKRLCQFHQFPAAVSCLAFSPDGSLLSIGCSSFYDCVLNTDKNINQIYIRRVTDTEVKPSRVSSVLTQGSKFQSRPVDYSGKPLLCKPSG